MQSSSLSETAPSYSKAHKLEQQILSFYNLELNKDLTITDIPLNDPQNNFLHTYHSGKSNGETLVLLHGYGGSSVLFSSVLKGLSQHFQVYCVDLLGMGLSSRNSFECKTIEETLVYFISSLEKWREIFNLSEFYLAGHSFGAYIAANYAMRHPGKVKKLLLVSPVGITVDQDVSAITECVDTMSWPKRKLFRTYIKLWEDKVTPSEFLKKHSIIGNFILSRYVNGQYNHGKNGSKISDLVYKLVSCMMKEMPCGSEKALHILLGPPMAIAHMPIENMMLEKIDVPTVFFYGETDWMDWSGAYRLANNEEKKNFKLKWVKKAGHQIFADNPEQITKDIIEILHQNDPAV